MIRGSWLLIPTTTALASPSAFAVPCCGVFRIKDRDTLGATQFDVVIERDADGYYVASVPQIRGCHTQARSLDELAARIREAILLCLEAETLPEPLEFVGVQRVTVAA